MIISLRNYVVELLYKSTSIFECDYDFFDEPFYLIDFEECDL